MSVKLAPKGIRETKNKGKYVVILLSPTNKKNKITGIFNIEKNILSIKNQKI
ncbi:hypothetical protein R2R32_12510 [Clostridium perfringens]|nr:hypothetical protein [Clostridium perfringens]